MIEITHRHMSNQDLSTLLAELDAAYQRLDFDELERRFDGPLTENDAMMYALVNAYPTLKAGIERLQAWKAEALAVEQQWDVQAVGRAVGAPLGVDIRPLILPAIDRLRALVEQQREALRDVEPWRTWLARWRRALPGEHDEGCNCARCMPEAPPPGYGA